MPTLMTRTTFELLRNVSDRMNVHQDAPVQPSNIFVPWAGDHLVSEGRGLYYVGIATDAEDNYGKQTFEARLSATEQFCAKPTRGRSPYWQFMNRLTASLLGGRYDRTQYAWGWSNLLKIAGCAGSPGKWGSPLIDSQKDACIISLREEVARLRQSLIVITSSDTYGILHEAAADESRWDTVKRPGCTYLLYDARTGNAFVHCYHPRYMRQNGHYEQAVAETLDYARQMLPPFPR